MPSSTDHCPACRQVIFSPVGPSASRRFWPSIVRIIFLEVVLLLAMAVAFVAYLNWSSDIAFAEFLAASKMPTAPSSALKPVKGNALCERGA